MIYKFLAIGSAIFALSVAGCAAENGQSNGNGKCTGKKCGSKSAGPAVNGSRPLVMEPQDTCKGTVKCVNQSKYPNGKKTEIIVKTPEGDKKVIMKQEGTTGVQPNDKVEIKGRNVEANGEMIMMGESLTRQGTTGLNNSVSLEKNNGKSADGKASNKNGSKDKSMTKKKSY
jgi:hypothetical protein